MTRQTPSRRERFIVFSRLGNPHSTENLSHRLEERVKESAHTEAEQLPEALQLDDVGPQTGHDAPDVIKTETSEVDSAHDGSRHATDGCNYPVTPILGGYKRVEAGSPHAINTVGTIRLSEHILKENLFGNKRKII